MLIPQNALCQGYNAPLNSRSTWKIIDDGMDAFSILQTGSVIVGIVSDRGETYIKVSISTSPQTWTLDPFIRYNSESYCIPFYVSLIYLSEDNQDLIDQHSEFVLGNTRFISVLLFKHVKIQDELYADWELYYDTNTGILTKWIMRDGNGKETLVQLINTNAWGTGAISPENYTWLIVLIIILGVTGVIVGVYFFRRKRISTPKVANVPKFQFK